MNKKSIKQLNYIDKDGFLNLKQFLKRSKVDKVWINKFNYRIAMSIFKYDKSKHKKINWKL